MLIRVLIVVMISMLCASLILSTTSKKRYEYVEPVTFVGAKANLAMSDEQFAPIIEAAKKKLDELYTESKWLDQAQRYITWFSIFVVGLVTVLAGLLGKPLNSTLGDGVVDSSEKLLAEANKNLGSMRIVTIFVALSTVSGLVSQQLDSLSLEVNSSANNLNQELISLTKILYDSNSSEAEARVSLQRFENLIKSL